MPKVSNKHLNKDIEKEMFAQFWKSLASINDVETTAQLFSDLLTNTERIMLAKRFTIALLLLRGRATTDIHWTLNVTYTTIGSVASWLGNARPKTRKVLLKLSKRKDWEAISDKMDELLDKLPLRYGDDWSKTGTQKHVQKSKRGARKSLR